MDKGCPLVARVSALEVEQERQSKVQVEHGLYLRDIAGNVECMAKSMKQLVEIIPLITMAQAIRSVAVWVAPIFAAAGVIAGFIYWLIGVING